MNLTIELVIRLFIAGVAGSVIGINREMHAKEAGIRTHFFVAFGSALFMVISKYGFMDMYESLGISPDGSRIAAQVVSGVGFLGAGTILINKNSIQGLTTAAGVWATSAIGLAIGTGQYILGIAATVLMLLGYELLRIMSTWVPVSVKTVKVSLYVKKSFSIEEFLAILRVHQYNVINYDFRIERREESYLVKLTLHILGGRKRSSEKFMEILQEKYAIRSIDING